MDWSTTVKNAGGYGFQGFVALILVLILCGCGSLGSTKPVQLDRDASWAVLAIRNLSQTADAEQQAASFIETQLRGRGVASLTVYAESQPVNLKVVLEPEHALGKSVKWAQNAGYQFGITGTINEWHYKSGAESDPVVGVSLKVLDLQSFDVLWQGNAAKVGWGYDSLSMLADDVIESLLDQLTLTTAHLRQE